MTILEEFKLFEKTVIKVGFEKVQQNTFRFYINPLLYVDIEFRSHYLLYTCTTKVAKGKEPFATLEYKQIIYRAEDLLWCDSYYIKRVIQSIFANMIKKHIDSVWDMVMFKLDEL